MYSNFGIPKTCSARSLLQCCYKKILRSLYVRPSTTGNISIVQSLILLGSIAASCTILGYTKRWMSIDQMLWLQRWSPPKLSNGCESNTIDHHPDKDETRSTTDTTSVWNNTIHRPNIDGRSNSSSTDRTSGRFVQFSQLFLRVLFVPSLCEELIWRCLLVPQPISNSKLSIFYIVLVNTCYTMSHVVHAKGLSLLFHQRPTLRPFHNNLNKNNHSGDDNDDDTTVTNRSDTTTEPSQQQLSKPTTTTADSIDKTIDAFTDPSFLFLTFCLGNVCSYSYIKAGYGLYAPVLIHAISVSVWLTFLGGNPALGRI